MMGPMRLPDKLRKAMIGLAGKPLFWLWFKLCRWTVVGRKEYDALRRAKKPVVLIIWHSRIFIVPYFFRRKGIMPLVSPSRDGEIPAQIMDRWGYKVLRGSGSHYMVKAWNIMVRELREGGEVLIVPDGPRGPNRLMKDGCLKLAQQTGAHIVPFTFSASGKKFLRSWDRFLMFPPFSRVAAVFGKPFIVKSKLSKGEMERLHHQAENLLNSLDSQAEAVLGRRAPAS
jgi:lysophospholipid acyltransferase (LPLAT)-like uncharacterized protein